MLFIKLPLKNAAPVFFAAPKNVAAFLHFSSRDSFVFFFLFSLLFCFLSVPLAAAEPVIEFDYLVQNNDSASFTNVRTYSGIPDHLPVFSNYYLTLEDSHQRILRRVYFPAYFIIFDPFIEVSTIPVTLTLPYQQEYATVTMYHKTKIISRQDLRFLCQKDGLCQAGENSISCPQDCPPGGKDNWCERKDDGICDPDCLILEKECQQENGAWSWGIFSVALAGLIATLLFCGITILQQRKSKLKQQPFLKKKLQCLLLTAVVLAMLVMALGILFWKG